MAVSFKIVKVAKKIKATTEALSNITWEQREGEMNSDLGGKMKRSIVMY